VGDGNFQRLEFAISDQSQFGAFREFLRLAAPDADVQVTTMAPGPGEQGGLDVLVLVASSGGLLAAIRVLPEFLKARRTGISISMKVKGEPFELTASNIDEVMPVLERLLDA
jgi:hypothetical protein